MAAGQRTTLWDAGNLTSVCDLDARGGTWVQGARLEAKPEHGSQCGGCSASAGQDRSAQVLRERADWG